MISMRRDRWCLLFLVIGGCPLAQAVEPTLHVAVLSHSPPMSYVDDKGNLAGFNVGIARALCDTLEVRCEWPIVSLEHLIDAVAAGEVDFAAVSLLDTPERRAKILFSKPYFHSTSVWFAKPGVEPGASAVRVGAVAGSTQFLYAQARNWKITTVRLYSELPALLTTGAVDAVLLSMATALPLRQDKSILPLGLVTTVMRQPELGGNVCFGVDPKNPDLRDRLDKAIDKIKRDGRFDRLNTTYLPFRLQ